MVRISPLIYNSITSAFGVLTFFDFLSSLIKKAFEITQQLIYPSQRFISLSQEIIYPSQQVIYSSQQLILLPQHFIYPSQQLIEVPQKVLEASQKVLEMARKPGKTSIITMIIN